MEPVGRTRLWSFLSTATEALEVTNTKVRADPGYFVDSYPTLASKVAELQWRNRAHVMLFRGQTGDYLSTKHLTMLRPTIFRAPPAKKTLAKGLVEKRFKALDEAEAALSDGYDAKKRLGRQRVARERLLRWSILQHYEVCPTPLLDVSQSLRIAASFASLGKAREAYLYVLASRTLAAPSPRMRRAACKSFGSRACARHRRCAPTFRRAISSASTPR
jgi:hypothetical protein